MNREGCKRMNVRTNHGTAAVPHPPTPHPPNQCPDHLASPSLPAQCKFPNKATNSHVAAPGSLFARPCPYLCILTLMHACTLAHTNVTRHCPATVHTHARPPAQVSRQVAMTESHAATTRSGMCCAPISRDKLCHELAQLAELAHVVQIHAFKKNRHTQQWVKKK